MKRLSSRMKRIERQLKTGGGSQVDIAKQSELIRQYLHDEITADEFSERSEVKHKELTPKQQQYRDDIFKKYLSN